LSIRDFEELFAQRGIEVSRKAVGCWVNKFGPLIAAQICRRCGPPTGRWHLNGMVEDWPTADAPCLTGRDRLGGMDENTAPKIPTWQSGDGSENSRSSRVRVQPRESSPATPQSTTPSAFSRT
jgi:hypothetical protein